MIRIVISLFLALSTPSLQAEEAAKLNHSTSRKCQDSDSAIPMEESLKHSPKTHAERATKAALG